MSAPSRLTILAKLEPAQNEARIASALRSCAGSVEAAASKLGVSARTLYRLMNERHKKLALRARAGK